MPSLHGMSFRARLALIALALVALSSVASGILDYDQGKRTLERHLGEELLSVTRTIAPLIDGDLLATIQTTGPGSFTGREEFDEIRAMLAKAAESNGLQSSGSPVYVMRPAPGYESSGELEFVVMTHPGKDGGWFVGNRYAARPHNRAALAGTPRTTGVYEDSEGIWISAAAPVRDRSGAVVGIVQADRPVNWFYDKAREHAFSVVWTSAARLLIAALVAVWVAAWVTRPLNELAGATRELARGNLDYRVDLNRGDELGALGDSINRMACSLQSARAELLEQRTRLSEALAAAEEASRSKSEFVASMSHELRTPLNAIIGYSQLLADESRDSGNTESIPDLERIEASGKHLLALINTILDFSKTDAGKTQLDLRLYPVDRMIGEVTSTVAPLVRQGNNELLTDNRIPEAEVLVDPLKFRQSLLNLLGNACKFTRNGSIRLEVDRASRDGRNWIAWRVADTGDGIAAEHIPKLFQPFSQVDGSITRRHGGTGLGLALSVKLCKLMSGDITVESEQGKGSTFTIWLPDPMDPKGASPTSARTALTDA